MFLLWIHPILREGWKGSLDPDAMAPAIPPVMDCADITRRAKAQWAAQQAAADPTKASIGRAFAELCRAYMLPGVTVMVIQGLTSTVLRPISLSLLIQAIEAQRDGTSTTGEAIAATAFFAAVSFGDNFLKVQGYQRVNVDSAATFNAAATSLIFDKMMRVVQSGQGARTTDSIANLVGSDVIGIREMFMILGMLPWALVGGIGGIIMTFVTLGPVSACVGLVVNFSLVFISTKLSRQLKKVEKARTALSDQRIQNLTQLIEGIKAVKYYAWEEPSTEKIAKIREAECVLIGKYRGAQAIAVQVGRASPPLAACAALVVYSYVHDEFSARNAFVTIAIFQALRPISIMLPTSFVYIMSLGNAFRRIQEFLSESDHPERQLTGMEEDVVAELSMCDLQWRPPESSEGGDEGAKSSSVDEKDMAVRSEKLGYDLRDVSMTVRRGTVTAVVGPVGSGKSTLISAVVGELVPKAGTVRSAKTLGYVQQKSFIISDTIKNNVLFGREWNAERFQEAMEASEFITDLEQLVDGIQTLVGERGATLSGGQQQRLSICRAIYGKPELLVLDDPLSALDSTVGEAIFIKAIRAFADDTRAGGGRDDSGGSSRQPAVLMATNQLHILSRCDHIVVLEDGAVRAQGTYAELQKDESIAQYLQMREEASVDDAADAVTASAASSSSSSSSSANDRAEASNENSASKAEAAGNGGVGKQQKGIGGKSEAPTKGDATRKAETLATGSISSSVYAQYARSLGWHSVAIWSIGLGFTYACTVGGDWWLTIWIDEKNAPCIDDPASVEVEVCSDNDDLYRLVYIAACLLFLAGAISTSTLLVRMGTRSGKTLHHDVFTKVLAAPLSWHEENPSGRLTSRFSAELLRVDIFINQFVDANSGMIYQLIATLIVIMIALPPIIPVVAVSSCFYVLQCILVDRGQRDLKRATNAALGPVMSNLSETLTGRVTVKAMGCDQYFIARHNERVDHFTRMDICSQTVLNFGNLAAGYVSFPVTSGCAIMAVIWGKTYDPEQLGLALSCEQHARTVTSPCPPSAEFLAPNALRCCLRA
jgi:ABC-type multidrug transport system fused ATPase/permease subunit